MLSKGDDYPIHQTPEPIAFVAGQRNFYDRYFFNGYDSDGEKFFAFALGVYPYLDVMDAAFSFVFDGVQHNVLASKVMGPSPLMLKRCAERHRTQMRMRRPSHQGKGRPLGRRQKTSHRPSHSR